MYVEENGRIPMEVQDRLAWEAADRMMRGEEALGAPFVIAAPDNDTGEAEDRQLVLLSKALERAIETRCVVEMSA
jgi:hypothetical protein